MSSILYVELLSATARVPRRAHEDDVGYDVFSDQEDLEIAPGRRALIKTGIKIRIPNGCYARVAPRSSLALQGRDVVGGVIDPGYLGEVGVIMANNGQDVFKVERGDKIAQLVFEACIRPSGPVEVMDVKHPFGPPIELVLGPCVPERKRERGEAGFGSTGYSEK